MKIKQEGGFIEAVKGPNGKVAISVGCEHYNPDGTRKEVVVNSSDWLSEEDIVTLFSDIWVKNKENDDKKSDE